MTETPEQPRGLQRFKSGIAGLDRILGGGLFIGGNYLVMGPPGAGKTILGNQLCFHHIATGGDDDLLGGAPGPLQPDARAADGPQRHSGPGG